MEPTKLEEEILARRRQRERLIPKAKKKMAELRKIVDAAPPILRDLAAYEQLINRTLVRRREQVRVDWPKVRYANGKVDFVPYDHAADLVRKKRAVILEEEPKYERTYIDEPEPKILDDIRKLNLGRPITIEGRISPVLRRFVERIGSESFDLTTAAAFQTLDPDEIERYGEDGDGEEKEER